VENTNILDQLLLPLADNFEAGNRSVRTFDPSSPEEFEPLRECIAGLIAEGSVEDFQKMRAYRLTPSGYAKYRERIKALRTLPR